MSTQHPTPRVALVTGGARGIGRSIVELLSGQGHRVAIADVLKDLADQLASETGALALGVDITDPASVEEGVRATEEQLGPIDILVNDAGWDELRPFLDTDEPFWEHVIDVNFKGCLRTCHRVVPGMIERRYGRIVNISSDAARVGSSLEAVYAGAKGAVISFTKTLAREVARYGVTANAVCPGPTQTPMLEGIVAANAQSAQLIDRLRRAVPMRRIGMPEDVASAVGFLVSEEAGFVTGQTLSVSGGLTMA